MLWNTSQQNTDIRILYILCNISAYNNERIKYEIKFFPQSASIQYLYFIEAPVTTVHMYTKCSHHAMTKYYTVTAIAVASITLS
jgi:hypothetical protein